MKSKIIEAITKALMKYDEVGYGLNYIAQDCTDKILALPFLAAHDGEVLPTVDEAGAIAVKLSDDVSPKLSAYEQAFFIAGFQECIKFITSTRPAPVKVELNLREPLSKFAQLMEYKLKLNDHKGGWGKMRRETLI